MAKEHLTFNREEPVTIKRPRKMSIPRPVLTDVIGHGQRMLTSLATAKETAQLQNQGFDNRLLFKIVISDIEGANLDSIPGVELISQEDRGIFLVFSSEGAIDEFEARLTMLVEGGVPTRKSLLEALEGFNAFTPKDRTGWALGHFGTPESQSFNVDVELWPITNHLERTSLITSFETWLNANQLINKDRCIFRSIVNSDSGPS